MDRSIVVEGAYGEYNFGDDALMKVIHEVYLPGFHTYGITYKGIKADYVSGIIAIDENIKYETGNLQEGKIIIYGGGTQFFSFVKRKKSIMVLNLLKSPHLLFKKILSRLAPQKHFNDDKKIISLGVGLGPFEDKTIEDKAKMTFSNMSKIFVRDLFSHNKCIEWGLKSELYTDICFQLEHPEFKVSKTHNSIEKIGVIVRDWRLDRKGSAYAEKLIQFVDIKRHEGYQVQYIVFSELKDLKWVSRLTGMDEDFLLWKPEEQNIQEFINVLSTFDLFITSRFHGAVFSSLLRKPFITIEVDPKLRHYNKVFHKSSKNWSFPFPLEILEKEFSEIEKNYPEFIINCDVETKNQVELSDQMRLSFQKELKQYLRNE